MNILININSYKNNYEIQVDGKEKIIWVNSKSVKVDVDKFISRLEKIISSWENRYISYSPVTDSENYEIIITKGNDVYTYQGINKFPPNYNEFIKLIKEII